MSKNYIDPPVDEEAMRKAEEEKEFLDLYALQDKVKRQPELYIKETSKAVEVFKEQYEKIKENPAAKNTKFVQYTSFLSHVNFLFQKDLEFFQNYIIDLLSSYAHILNPYIRHKVVQAFILIRNKGVIGPFKCIQMLFKLLAVKDKELRSMCLNHIVHDIKRINQHSKNNSVNKQIQNHIYGIITNTHDNLAKRAMVIMIELYRKNVWNDAKSINVISNGCFNENPKIVLLTCQFLISTTEGKGLDDDSDSEDEVGMKKDLKVNKRTKAKVARKERELKNLKRRERRKTKIESLDKFFPIDLIFNPQDFCDRLFAQLKKKSFKFEVNLAMMHVLARMIGRNKLLVLNYYPFLQKYLNPHQKEIAQILACLAEACHDLVPPEEIMPVLKHLVDNFVNERCHEEKINFGLNTIREMCAKAPLIMDESTLNYLASYKEYKNKNVKVAARALINLFRDLNPELLQKEHRGRFDLLDKKELRKVYRYGEQKVYDRVDGAELLQKNAGVDSIPIEADRILDDADFKKIKVLRKRKLIEHLDSVRDRNKHNKEEKNGEEYYPVDEVDFRGEAGPEDDSDDYEDEDDEEEDDGASHFSIDSDAFDDDGEDDDEEEEEEEEEEGEEGAEGEDGKEMADGEENGEKSENAVKKDKKKVTAKSKKNGKVNGSWTTVSKSNLDNTMAEEEDDDDEVDTDELEEESSDEENPHGFVKIDNINSYKKNKKERKHEKNEKLDELREKKYNGPKTKGGGKTNKEKLKSKPLMMVRPKKNTEKHRYEDTKSKIKDLKQNLGHFNKRKGNQFKLKLKKKKASR